VTNERPSETLPPRTAYACWLIAEQEGGGETRRRLRYHDLMVQYGFLIETEEAETGPRFACGWDPDPSRRALGTI
jgi:hypothetical protein